MFIALVEFLLRDAEAVEAVFLVGMLGVVVLAIQLRATWVIYRHIRTAPSRGRRPGLY